MKQTEEQRACRLLRLREEGATFKWTYFLRSPLLWVTAIAVVVMLTYTLTGEPGPVVNRAVWLGAGVFIGRLLRDYLWLKDIVDATPFLVKVLDWDKVEELASQAKVR